MFPLRRKRRATEPASQPDLPDVSQPMPLTVAAAREPDGGITVTELSELEARALCAREDIAVFWPRVDRSKRRA